MAMGQIPRATERISSLNKKSAFFTTVKVGFLTTKVSFLYHRKLALLRQICQLF